VVICLERYADFYMAQVMPLPLSVSCFTKIQIGFTFLVLAYPGSPGKGPLNGGVCVCAAIEINLTLHKNEPKLELYRSDLMTLQQTECLTCCCYCGLAVKY